MFTEFNKDENLNKRLSKLWDINNKLAKQQMITDEERVYFNENLLIIQTYYSSAARYWAKLEPNA